MKEGGDLISWGEPILQNGWINWNALLYFSFKSFKDPNSSSFIRFKNILYDSRVLFSDFWNFQILKRGWPSSLVGTNSPEQLNYLVPPFSISILKVLRTPILPHSLGFNAFCMIQEYFSQNFEIPQIKEGWDLISWRKPILQKD